MLFEVFDLQYASPATISRCGMVYVDPKDLSWQPYLWKWLNTRENEAELAELRKLCDKYLEVCIDFVCEGIEDKANMIIVEPPRCVTPMSNLAMIQQLTVMLIGLLFVLLVADVRLAELLSLGWSGLFVAFGCVFLVRPLSVAAGTSHESSSVAGSAAIADSSAARWLSELVMVPGPAAFFGFAAEAECG